MTPFNKGGRFDAQQSNRGDLTTPVNQKQANKF